MRKKVAAAMALSVFAALSLPVHAAQDPADRARIEEVVEKFRVSIIKKDKASFMKLFYNDKTSWIGVTTDKSLAHINARKTDPNKPGPRKVYDAGTPLKFIEGIVAEKEPSEEKFENVRIDSDGDVAQVWFDYSFHFDGYQTNWGKESWHMVRAPDGWKINSVIFSMEFNPEPPPKPAKKS